MQNLIFHHVGEFRLGQPGKGKIEQLDPVARNAEDHRSRRNPVAPQQAFQNLPAQHRNRVFDRPAFPDPNAFRFRQTVRQTFGTFGGLIRRLFGRRAAIGFFPRFPFGTGLFVGRFRRGFFAGLRNRRGTRLEKSQLIPRNRPVKVTDLGMIPINRQKPRHNLYAP